VLLYYSKVEQLIHSMMKLVHGNN